MTTSPSDKIVDRLLMDPSYNPTQYAFTIDELRAIYGIVEHQYIPYENEAGHAAINKITRIIREYELATGPGKSA